MFDDYMIIANFLGTGMIQVFGRRGYQNWVKTNRCVRKKHKCGVCQRWVEKERMYRPLGNPINRGDRICVQCGDLPE